MNVLLRMYDGKYYVWKEAVWSRGKYIVDGSVINAVNILAVKDDNRKKSVVCNNCGAIIDDNPEAIERHFAEQEAKKDCLKCESLRLRNTKRKSREFVRNEDGTYTYTDIGTTTLMCNQSYYNDISIEDNCVNRYCIHYQCRLSGVDNLFDVFIEYPGVFDKQITVDLLKKNGYEYEGCHNGFFEYDLRLRGALKACVNELGIIDHFVIKYRNYSVMAYYSNKYNEVFYYNYGNYGLLNNEYVSQSKHDAVKAKISALYKEASK